MHLKYDLIFSLGKACSCSGALRRSVLQVESYPFDWLFGSDYLGRCKILSSDFNHFIDKEDLEYSKEERNINCIAYHNKYNDITFNHDFLKSLPFDNAYIDIRKKYEKRIERLLYKIHNSQKILIVYIEIPSKKHVSVSDSDIVIGYNMIRKHFGKEMDLLYIKNSKSETIYRALNSNITQIICDYKDTSSSLDYAVNRKALCEVLKDYRLENLPFGYRYKVKIIRCLIKLVPIKSARESLRKKHHIY